MKKSRCVSVTKSDKVSKLQKMKGKRKNPSYRLKVRLIQETDGNCSFCDFSDAGRLVFHHIDENPANTVFDNLIAVCPNCHSSIGEGTIKTENVRIRKEELKTGRAKKTDRTAMSIQIKESNLNNPVIGNNNTVNITVRKQKTKKVVEKYPEGSIGRDVIMYGYAKYLADRYAEYKSFELKQLGKKFNYPAFYGKVKKDFKSGGFFQIPQSRFFDLVTYLQARIDRTKLSRVNKGKGIEKNYSSFEEYKIENKITEE